MNEKDIFGQTERLLGRFDFTVQLATKEREHRQHLRRLLLSFVEVMDSFDRFLAGLGESEEATPEAARQWLKTFRLIGRQFEQALRDAGVSSISCLGQKAEPGRHEIIGVVEAPGVGEDTIVQEVFRGYKWDGEILRKPRVKVARGTN